MQTNDLNPAEILTRQRTLQADEIEALRELVERYPYYATARLMLLEQMYRRHDSGFDAELRRSALLLADRRVLFDMVEGANYEIPQENVGHTTSDVPGDRTLSLIEGFLETDSKTKGRPKMPAVADPTQDYVGYLLAKEAEEAMTNAHAEANKTEEAFEETEKIADNIAAETPDDWTQEEDGNDPNSESRNATMTETMAQIYIKQHKYERALEIIRALSLNNPKKNAYFADQIRFLEKLISLNIKQKH